METKIKHICDSEIESRFDRYLKKILPSIKQSSIEEFIRKKKIQVLAEGSDKKLTSGFRIKKDDVILICKKVWGAYQNEQQIESKKQYKPNSQIIDLFKKAIIFENKDFLVLNKPVNFSCQGGNNIIHSIDEIMRFIYGDEIRIVHRLDRKTSGILLMGKNLKYAQLLTKFFKEKLIEKTYYAICENDYNQSELKNQILHGKRVLINKALKSKLIGGEEKIVIDDENGDEAISEVGMIKKIDQNLFLIKIKPKTGRKHQIRVHLNSIGFPILGDTKYNKKKSSFKNMFLHAGEIKIDQKDLRFEIKCDFPQYFRDLLKIN